MKIYINSGNSRNDIERIGNLSLGYKTFIDKKPRWNDLEICQWDLLNNVKWTIAMFYYEPGEDCYVLNSCGDRLNDKDIDWEAFGFLVQKAYSILETEVF